MLIYSGMTALDLIGPQQVLGYLPNVKVELVAADLPACTKHKPEGKPVRLHFRLPGHSPTTEKLIGIPTAAPSSTAASRNINDKP
jgi:hypothetical protein